jgi:CheY-like chemotaxis protein
MNHSPPSNAHPPCVREPVARRRILLADDDEDIRSVFELVLSEHFDVTCAQSGSEALALALALLPDVVLVDWTLPDASGGELVAQLRASAPELANVPVVVVSGAASVKALAESIGAVPCSKPCDVEQLLAAIERALSGLPRS